MAAIALAKSCCAIKTRHIGLQTVCGQVCDLLAGIIDSAFGAQFVRSALLREDEARPGHQATMHAPVQRRALVARPTPLDIALQGGNRFGMGQINAPLAAPFGDRGPQAYLILNLART